MELAEEGTPPASAELLAELNGMKLRALQARAEALGVDDEKLDDAEEKTEVIALIVEILEEQAAKAEAQRVEAIKEELAGMKLRALQRRATEVGVPEEKLDDAEEKSEVIELILAALQPSGGDVNEDKATKGAEADRLAQLKEDLSGMKLRALQQRASELGIADAALDEAEEKSEVIELILAEERNKLTTTKTSQGSHGGAALLTQEMACTTHSTFKQWAEQGLHIMFSYQWDVQKEVQEAFAMLQKKGAPVWMDTNGGMAADIYDSMAEGVSNAAVLVCFMTQKYQNSKNCALELKFAAQTGVPIVPVMMQEGFVASGWLGILTAGLLWTRLWTPSTFAEDIDSLVTQIVQVADPNATDAEATSEKVVLDEVKDELLRLRQDTELQPASEAKLTREAKIPALVPSLPAGTLVTTAMEELLSKLVDPSSSRVGFCGMGGIGKTVISSWLVRQSSVRQSFTKILWVTLGQTPNLDHLQRVLYEQLVAGGAWDESTSDVIKTQRMSEAFSGQNVLLILDDLWNTEHEKALNFVDTSTASKVLVSSRVRATLEGSLSSQVRTNIVQIELPNETQGVEMLLSTAGISAGQPAPKEAVELVRFCRMLPLAISIAGQLVKDLELQAAEDWDGIVTLMKDEFADGSRQSVEDTVILTSLKSITGTHKDNVTSLFKCLAIVPEDTIVPLDMLAMIYQAGCSTDEKPTSRPKIIMIRRWLKVLLERSLVLGTVDRISLHDIVRDFTLSMYTAQELQQAHRRLVNLLRENRPQAPSLVPAWSTAGEIGQIDKTVAYVRDAVSKHIQAGISEDWESDDVVVDGWLGDSPQDIITHATAKVLGMKRLEKLVAAAEVANDQWALARRAIATGYLIKKETGDTLACYDWLRRGADALGKVAADDATAEERQTQEALELETLGLGLAVGSSPEDAKYMPRMQYLVQQEHLDRITTAKASCYVFITTMSMFSDLSGYGDNFVMWLKTLAPGARSHPDPRMRWLCKLFIASAAMSQPCYTNEDWDWDSLYLDSDGTNFMQQVTEFYTFEGCHNFLVTEEGCWGNDQILASPLPANIMAHHYGQLVEAVKHYEETAMPGVDQMLALPNQGMQITTYGLLVCGWLSFALDMNRPTPLRVAQEKLKATWVDADETWDTWLQSFALPLRARGETTEGMPMSVEQFGWLTRIANALVGGAEEVAADEIAASLPTWEEHVSIMNVGLPFSYWYAVGGEGGHLGCLIGLLYEKLGRFDEALDWAKRAAALDDPFKGGNLALPARMRGLRLQGRCLAAKGQKSEAEAALTSAAEQLATIGYYLAEVLALRDLFVHVLKATDREDEGLMRLKVAVVRLVGVDATSEQLDVLATSLGDGVELAAVLEHGL